MPRTGLASPSTWVRLQFVNFYSFDGSDNDNGSCVKCEILCRSITHWLFRCPLCVYAIYILHLNTTSSFILILLLPHLLLQVVMWRTNNVATAGAAKWIPPSTPTRWDPGIQKRYILMCVIYFCHLDKHSMFILIVSPQLWISSPIFFLLVRAVRFHHMLLYFDIIRLLIGGATEGSYRSVHQPPRTGACFFIFFDYWSSSSWVSGNRSDAFIP